MPEKETIFSSSIKHTGLWDFKEFYKFCFDWLKEETKLDPLAEEKYEEKIVGDKKEVIIKWKGKRKLTDYFRFVMEVKFEIRKMGEVEVMKGNTKVTMNDGQVKMEVKGILERDYDGKFEKTAHRKFTRGIYERWVIPARIDEFEAKVAGDCDKFLDQAKAFLGLEGKR